MNSESIMRIDYCDRGTLNPGLCRRGLEFIRRRFLEEWSINRIDVSEDTISNRDNLIIYDNGRIVGWLGIEEDGELTNACIENEYNGSKILLLLIRDAYERAGDRTLFALVPVERLSSAIIFIKSGMVIEKREDPVFLKLVYPEREIVLIKIVKSSPKLGVCNESLKEELKKLQEVAHAYAKYNIPNHFI